MAPLPEPEGLEGSLIIRRSASLQQLITQPAHAALAARIMQEWDRSHFPDSPHRGSILHAVEQHDSGWASVDETLILEAASGRLLDFTEVSDEVKRDTSRRGIDGLAGDPYAAALVAQHRLHVYRRYQELHDWSSFFADMESARGAYLRASGESSLDQLLRDYAFVRAGDLASLAFCNNWQDTADDGCGYSMRLDEATLIVTPDPFEGRTIEIEIDAREIENRPFASATDARGALSKASPVRLTGRVVGRR